MVLKIFRGAKRVISLCPRRRARLCHTLQYGINFLLVLYHPVFHSFCIYLVNFFFSISHYFPPQVPFSLNILTLGSVFTASFVRNLILSFFPYGRTFRAVGRSQFYCLLGGCVTRLAPFPHL